MPLQNHATTMRFALVAAAHFLGGQLLIFATVSSR
jgi:hypothetical protein